MELLRVRVDEGVRWTVVTASGQLDVATAPDLRQALVAAQVGEGRRVAVDLSELEFVDSFGLGVLVGAVRRARSREGQLVVVCGEGRVRRVLGLAGLDELLGVTDSLGEVLGEDDGPIDPGSRTTRAG